MPIFKVKLPRYWKSNKGKVIKAIVFDRAFLWEDLCEATGLKKDLLNSTLSELYDLKILERFNGEYRVVIEIWKEYVNLYKLYESEKKNAFKEEEQKKVIDWLDGWKKVKGLDFNLENKHFFLEGRHLDELSKEFIENAKMEVVVVNPFVNNCALSDTLRKASNNGVVVRLITRPPEEKDDNYYYKKHEYHDNLKKDGVNLFYNKQVHAKLVVVDRHTAILSSMNFYSGSSSGAVWEAGIISFEKSVVMKIIDSILELFERPETSEYSLVLN